MARLHVRDTFQISGRQLYVLAGSVVEGVIQVGMFVRVPFNRSLNLTLRIHCLEFARRQGGEDVCLCVAAEPEIAEILSGLDIGDELLEVTTNGSHQAATDASTGGLADPAGASQTQVPPGRPAAAPSARGVRGA